MGEGEGQWTGADVTVVQTDTDAKDGQIKCPKCGSTDIQTNSRTGKLRCSFCRHEFEPQLLETEEDVSSLEGVRMGSGAQDRAADANDVITAIRRKSRAQNLPTCSIRRPPPCASLRRFRARSLPSCQS